MLEILQNKLSALESFCAQKPAQVIMNAAEIKALVSSNKWLSSLTEGDGVFINNDSNPALSRTMKLTYDDRTWEYTATFTNPQTPQNNMVEISGIHSIELEVIENVDDESKPISIIRLLTRDDAPQEYNLITGILP
jgi:hypothetical protein